ncbi:hypothetical protein ACLOJK_015119 [Asimina triloba]
MNGLLPLAYPPLCSQLFLSFLLNAYRWAAGSAVIVDGDRAEDGLCACRRWILNDRPAGVVMNEPDRSIEASPEDPSPAAMAPGLRRMMEHQIRCSGGAP